MRKYFTITFLIFVMILIFSPYDLSNVIHSKFSQNFDTTDNNAYPSTIFQSGIQSEVSGKSDPQSTPDAFDLFQNYPNPFNPVTTIEYSVPRQSYVSLKIYNTLGNEITTLVDDKLQPGVYSTEFDGSGLSSGVYYVQMTAGKYVKVKKMILLK